MSKKLILWRREEEEKKELNPSFNFGDTIHIYIYMYTNEKIKKVPPFIFIKSLYVSLTVPIDIRLDKLRS